RVDRFRGVLWRAGIPETLERGIRDVGTSAGGAQSKRGRDEHRQEPSSHRESTIIRWIPMQKGIAAALFSAIVLLSPGQAQAPAPTTFATRIAELSEPPGSFDTDNLISNERSYLQVIPALRSAGLKGGAYIGVGPDQNFSYIARIRPSIAFIVDIR